MICAFCGHADEPIDPDDAKRSMAEHIAGCDKHPLHEAAKKIVAKDAEVKALEETVEKLLTGSVVLACGNPIVEKLQSEVKALLEAGRFFEAVANAGIPSCGSPVREANIYKKHEATLAAYDEKETG